MRTLENGYTTESYVIPADIIAEAAQIILQAGLPHEITASNQERQELTLNIAYRKDHRLHQQALENLYDLLSDYNDLRYEENASFNWKDA